MQDMYHQQLNPLSLQVGGSALGGFVSSECLQIQIRGGFGTSIRRWSVSIYIYICVYIHPILAFPNAETLDTLLSVLSTLGMRLWDRLRLLELCL